MQFYEVAVAVRLEEPITLWLDYEEPKYRESRKRASFNRAAEVYSVY